jgi:hypothetical protein
VFSVSAAGDVLSLCGDRVLRLWNALVPSSSTLFEGPAGRVVGALKQNGRVLAWSEDGTVRTWDERSGAPQLVLEGHGTRSLGATFLEDGRLLTWCEGPSLRLWDAETGALVREFVVPDRVPSLDPTLEVHVDAWSQEEILERYDEHYWVENRPWVRGRVFLGGEFLGVFTLVSFEDGYETLAFGGERAFGVGSGEAVSERVAEDPRVKRLFERAGFDVDAPDQRRAFEASLVERIHSVKARTPESPPKPNAEVHALVHGRFGSAEDVQRRAREVADALVIAFAGRDDIRIGGVIETGCFAIHRVGRAESLFADVREVRDRIQLVALRVGSVAPRRAKVDEDNPQRLAVLEACERANRASRTTRLLVGSTFVHASCERAIAWPSSPSSLASAFDALLRDLDDGVLAYRNGASAEKWLFEEDMSDDALAVRFVDYFSRQSAIYERRVVRSGSDRFALSSTYEKSIWVRPRTIGEDFVRVQMGIVHIVNDRDGLSDLQASELVNMLNIRYPAFVHVKRSGSLDFALAFDTELAAGWQERCGPDSHVMPAVYTRVHAFAEAMQAHGKVVREECAYAQGNPSPWDSDDDDPDDD